MKVLIAIGDMEIRDILSFAVETATGSKPSDARNAKLAVEWLAQNPGTDLVICEHPGTEILRQLEVMNRGREVAKRIRAIVCHGNTSTPPESSAILGFARWDQLIDETLGLIAGLQRAAEPTPSEPAPTVEAEFCRIKTSLLIAIGVLKAGIYIRLSSTKFLKIFQEGDVFEVEDYQRILTEKGVEYLYLKQEESAEFLLKLKARILLLIQGRAGSETSDPETLATIHETVQELFTKLGPTAEVQEVVRANIQLTVKAMAKSPGLSEILGRLDLDREKYISSHSVLLPNIACALATSMDWTSEPTLQKIALASFLHDMALTNHTLAAVPDLAQLTARKEEFSENEIRDYRTHPLKAAEWAKQMQEVPPDVDIIVLQHHERPDGSGFPRGLTSPHISPLAAVFIVAHDLVTEMMNPTRKFVLAQFLEEKKTEYQGGNFRKLLHHLGTLKV